MKNEEIKLCKNCKWCEFFPYMDGKLSNCKNPNITDNLITGIIREPCSLARRNIGRCGIDAKYYEVKI